ncbi:branched-chain amino acid aminotransferase [Sphingosinicella rhizophila]|uniref:Branched-chain-amino-acid aminotransferase n=1 Tax=Sphingosinicella rhizophila TaxID=3050082 RepID=A0ABU3QAD7_9SPHN|nr:branched-chain amino acid aminotransferase [Sphingosinicella sp. GR2756]MDT9600380.1 branched-chain amino acid aminotransferase [Sphingosinicella sp. GR2756]
MTETIAPYSVAPGVDAALAAYSAPATLGFGIVPAPVMFSAEYRDGAWQPGELLPFGPISIMPNSRTVQFAESIFEGMKAYRARPAPPHLFRPLVNCARFAASAARIGMPAVPEALFLQGIKALVSACADVVPDREGASLYLRPILFSTDPGYSVANSNAYRYMVLASPSDPYSSGPMRARIERDDVRAARGGVGFAKTGGNYAAAMRATSRAVQEGYGVALWLDPVERRLIDEFSGMNMFAVIDGELHTPLLTDSILKGVTRDSVITLAHSQGLVVHERPIAIDELLTDIAIGRCTEVIATGTAAIVTSVSELGDADGRIYRLSESLVSDGLRSALLAIQTREGPDSFGWTMDIDD